MLNFIKKKVIFFILLLVCNISFALPNKQQFSFMCKDRNKQLQAEILTNKLDNSTLLEKTTWIQNPDILITAASIKNLLILEIILKICLEEHIDFAQIIIDECNISLLDLVILNHDIAIVKLLLFYKHCVIMKSDNTSSPLHLAAKQGKKNILNLLLEYSNPYLIHTKDNHNYTPINYLLDANIHDKESYIIDLLTKFPVEKTNTPLDSKQQSYLHHAVINPMKFLVQKLLEQDFNPLQEAIDKSTPISIAKAQKNNGILKLLIEAKNKKYSCYFSFCIFNVVIKLFL